MQKTDKIWLDGELVDWDDANVHILSHTLHYGLGVFEGIRAYQRADGRSHIFRLEPHIDRLFDGAKICLMDMPLTKQELTDACIETVQANRLSSCYLRPIAFMGDGEMGLGALSNRTRVAVVAWPWGAYLGADGLKQGIRAKISSFTRSHVNSQMVKGKIMGQYVNSVLAKREALKAGYDEALLLDITGYLAEGSGQNLFMVRDGVVVTPGRGSSLLNGITRNCVITLARDLGFEVIEERFTRDELYIADEVFLCGSAAEITPVREVDDRAIGDGKVGPISSKLQRVFFDVVQGSHEGYTDWLHYYEV